MRSSILVLLLVAFYPNQVSATTAQDLSTRIVIDGDASDFDFDEWIIDGSTTFVEKPGDSRWGLDNDVRAVALTWDEARLYVAVSAVTANSTLMLFFDTGCGGVNDLKTAGLFRRNIEFGGIIPNLLVARDGLGRVDCNSPFDLYDPDRYESVRASSGVLELAIPWELVGDFVVDDQGVVVPASGRLLGVVVVVTGGVGTGAGDAAPDPSVVLENDSTRVAILNNYLRIPLDANGDGRLDVGVSPRAVATAAIASTEQTRQRLPVHVTIEEKVFSPEAGETLRFRVSLDPPDYGLPVFLTARVYSSNGHLVRNLFDNLQVGLSSGSFPDEWDGRDNHGGIVPGGVYILAVSGGPAAGRTKDTVKASFAVIR